jgi:hypothetical protein
VKALLVLPLVLAVGAASPLPGIPRYAEPYKSWPRLNSKPLPKRASDPHPATKNVYASKLPPRGSTGYPVGTVIVKEGRNRGFVSLIAVMRKTTARAHNGWVMIEWTRSSATARFTEIARGQVCYSCHVGARKRDYVFTRRR